MTTTKTQVNAETTQNAIHKAWPAVTADFSARAYPVKESENTSTQVIPGNAQELKDKAQAAESKADSLQRYINTLPVKPECQPEVEARDQVIASLRAQITSLNALANNLRADKELTTKTLTQESTAALEAEKAAHAKTLDAYNAEQEAVKKTETEKQAYKEERDKAYWLLGIFALGIGILLVAKFLLRK